MPLLLIVQRHVSHCIEKVHRNLMRRSKDRGPCKLCTMHRPYYSSVPPSFAKFRGKLTAHSADIDFCEHVREEPKVSKNKGGVQTMLTVGSSDGEALLVQEGTRRTGASYIHLDTPRVQASILRRSRTIRKRPIPDGVLPS